MHHIDIYINSWVISSTNQINSMKEIRLEKNENRNKSAKHFHRHLLKEKESVRKEMFLIKKNKTRHPNVCIFSLPTRTNLFLCVHHKILRIGPKGLCGALRLAPLHVPTIGWLT